MRRKRRDRRRQSPLLVKARPWSQRTARLALMGAAAWSLLMVSDLAHAQGTPSITGYTMATPSGALATATVDGSNFGTTAGTVTLNGADLQVASWSDTAITVDIPDNAAPGPLEVDAGGVNSAPYQFRGWNNGYYTVSTSGVVTAYGKAQFYGDLQSSGITSSSAIIQIIATPDGKGYWLLAASGQLYPFGDAGFSAGALGGGVSAKQFVALPSGTGGYLLTSTNQVVPVGSGATVYGQAPSGTTVNSIAIDPAGDGYWLLTSSGAVLSFGSAAPWTTSSPPSSYTVTPPQVSNGSFVKVANTNPVYWYENGVLYHVPDVTVFNALGGQWSQVQSLWELPAGTIGLPLDVPYPDGSLVQPVGQTAIYFVWNGVLRHIADPTVFTDMGLSWNQVQQMPAIEPWWPVGPAITSSAGLSWPTGMLVRQNGTNPVYMIDNGSLDWVTNQSVFSQLGLKWSMVQVVSFLPPLPHGPDITSPTNTPYATGSLVRLAGTDPVYYMQEGTLHWIPTLQMFDALNFSFSNVLVASSLAGQTIGANVGSVADSEKPGVSVTMTPQPVSIVPNVNGSGGWVVWSNGTIQADGGAPAFASPSLSNTNVVTGVASTPNDRGLILTTTQGEIPLGTVQTWGLPGTTPMAFSPVAAPDEVSAGFGPFYPSEPSGNSSYQDMQNYGSQMSLIQPYWFNVAQNSDYTWHVTEWPSTSDISTVVNTAHSQNILVMPSIGAYYTPSSTLSASNNDPMAGTSAQVSSFISQVVGLTTKYNLDGITIDFENSGTGSLGLSGASQQYTSFIQQLGQALHAAGKRLIISVYAAPYQDGTIYNNSVLQNYVDWLDVMTYEEHNSATPPGPTTGIGWQEYWISQELSTGVLPSKILMGLAPYGYSWSMSPTSGVTGVSGTNPNTSYSTDRSIEQMVAQDNIKTYWDPNQDEMFFTTGSTATAPTGTTYSTANVSQVISAVQDIQSLVNIVNDIHAINSGTTLSQWPVYLWADGQFGSYTQQAVEEFQSWAVPSEVGTAGYGTYDAATAAALQNYINQYNVGSVIWWDDTPQSIQDRLNFVIADHLGGIDTWRFPFESTQYFNVLAQTSAVNKY
ncbi:MAG: glycosyl hydrolase family 18 protein [Clostridia bacterium]